MSITHHHYPGIKCWHSGLVILVVMLLAVATVALVTISGNLKQITREFRTTQEIQKDVKHLNEVTKCLEPARYPEPELPEIE